MKTISPKIHVELLVNIAFEAAYELYLSIYDLYLTRHYLLFTITFDPCWKRKGVFFSLGGSTLLIRALKWKNCGQ